MNNTKYPLTNNYYTLLYQNSIVVSALVDGKHSTYSSSPRKRKTSLCALGITLFLFLCGLNKVCQAQIIIQPEIIQLELEPGAYTVTPNLNIQNWNKNQKVKVTISQINLCQVDNQIHPIDPCENTQKILPSCRDWITLEQKKTQFALKPGFVEFVNLSLSIPEHAEGIYWSAMRIAIDPISSQKTLLNEVYEYTIPIQIWVLASENNQEGSDTSPSSRLEHSKSPINGKPTQYQIGSADIINPNAHVLFDFNDKGITQTKSTGYHLKKKLITTSASATPLDLSAYFRLTTKQKDPWSAKISPLPVKDGKDQWLLHISGPSLKDNVELGSVAIQIIPKIKSQPHNSKEDAKKSGS